MAAKNPNVNRANQFGSFFHDVNHQVGTGYPNYPLYQDATASANKSPLALTTTPVQLKIPGAAVSVTLTCTQAFRVGDQSAIDSTTPYATFPSNVPIPIPVATPTDDPNDTTGYMWVATDSSTGNLSFFFSCV
jgi:hypothetical protein